MKKGHTRKWMGSLTTSTSTIKGSCDCDRGPSFRGKQAYALDESAVFILYHYIVSHKLHIYFHAHHGNIDVLWLTM
jgi:hypothetical protein